MFHFTCQPGLSGDRKCAIMQTNYKIHHAKGVVKDYGHLFWQTHSESSNGGMSEEKTNIRKEFII